jgi:hypothetical protein
MYSKVIHILTLALLLVLSLPIWMVQVIFVVAYRAFVPDLS